jgi:hypothetical protein
MTLTNPSGVLNYSAIDPLSMTYAQIPYEQHLFSKISNLDPSGIVINNVPVTMPSSNNMKSNAFGLASFPYVSKVVLAADNVYFNTNPDGSHIPNFNHLPWVSKEFIDMYPNALSKIFASDGITPAVTAVTGVSDAVSAMSLLQGSLGSHLYGAVLADQSMSFTTYASFMHGTKAIGSSNLTVIDTPANAFNLGNLWTAVHTTFQVKDSAANIHAQIESLNNHQAQIDSIVFTDPVTAVSGAGGQSLDGSNGHSIFEFSATQSNAVGMSNTLTGWSNDDVIEYSQLMKVVQSAGPASAGIAHIDSSGYATFANNNENLTQQILDVEGALAHAQGTPQAGTVVKWDGSGADAGNSYVLITGNHANPTDSSHDQVIKIVGVDASHSQIAAGVVVHHN